MIEECRQTLSFNQTTEKFQLLESFIPFLKLCLCLIAVICPWALTSKAISKGFSVQAFQHKERLFLRFKHDGSFPQNHLLKKSESINKIHVLGMKLAAVDNNLEPVSPFTSSPSLEWKIPANTSFETTFEAIQTNQSNVPKNLSIWVRLSFTFIWYPIDTHQQNS